MVNAAKHEIFFALSNTGWLERHCAGGA